MLGVMTDGKWQRLSAALRNVGDIDKAVAAAAELQAKASAEDVPRLLELLLDDSFFVREAAAWPLSDLGWMDALSQLLCAYQRGLDEGHDNDGFSAALIDLVTAKPSAAKPRLESLAAGADPSLSINAK